MSLGRFFIVGGAGFIGSHFTDMLLGAAGAASVTIYDNLSSGREWHFAKHLGNPKFKFVKGDVKDLETLRRAMDGSDVVIHLASNPDIARAATEPDVDFREGTYLTERVVEAMRLSSAKRILYASGSGVYGDLGPVEASEDYGPMVPISTYGASKLAGEALIASYCHMFDLSACVFRFGNVVGPRQTHGVGFDFVRALRKDPGQLRILGNGGQSKSYIYVEDVVGAVLAAHEKTKEKFQAYNVATGDYITVKEIAALAVECVGLERAKVNFEFTGGDRGWKGDVAVIRLNTERIRRLGWANKRNSREALRESMMALLRDAELLYAGQGA
ncbi:MAG TPA: NAD-dependent epimerase/dehydratase family protein [Candidatus Eisenbacteria bacterium]|nr:NAD-dependent epimerase/dehydratase family protein [Candidatus Eisenbacteria bacterium]